MIPMSEDAITPLVEPHLGSLARVLTESWNRFATLRDERPDDMLSITTSSRGMLVSDYVREPAHRIFGGVEGVVVDDRYGRAWLSLADGAVSIRFRKLTPTLGLCRSDSDRSTALAYHLPDPYLPGMPDSTVLTAGYVLDAPEIALERLMLTCHFGNELLYAIKLPGGAVSAPKVSIQLPTNPLAPPIIRSARRAVKQRLIEGRPQ